MNSQQVHHLPNTCRIGLYKLIGSQHFSKTTKIIQTKPPLIWRPTNPRNFHPSPHANGNFHHPSVSKIEFPTRWVEIDPHLPSFLVDLLGSGRWCSSIHKNVVFFFADCISFKLVKLKSAMFVSQCFGDFSLHFPRFHFLVLLCCKNTVLIFIRNMSSLRFYPKIQALKLRKTK